MKYNEAIDMIFNGGRAQPVNSPRWTNRAVWIELNRDFTLNKEDILADWIVEKDGVVYEEYPKVNVSKCGSPICRDIIRNCYECQRDNEMCPPHNYFRANNKCYDPPECTCEYNVKLIKGRTTTKTYQQSLKTMTKNGRKLKCQS